MPDIDISVIAVGPTGASGPSPYASINDPYSLKIAKEVELDGSGVLARDGFLVKYEWNIDADRAFERATSTAELTHTFN